MYVNEMIKLYRKTVKAIENFEREQNAINNCTINGDMEYIAEHAKNLAKWAKVITEILDSCKETYFQNIKDNLENETAFVVYMIKKGF